MAITQEFEQDFTHLYEGYPHEKAARGWLGSSLFHSNKHRNVLAFVKPQAHDVIVEAGSSSGKLTIDCALKGAKVIGVDLDPNALEVSRAVLRLFPEVKDRVQFILGDLTEMTLPSEANKVLLIDFTEHLEDDFLKKMLLNFQRTIPHFTLYIYTPNRTHFFEYLRIRNIILKENKTHIGLRTMAEYKAILVPLGFTITRAFHLPSHVPVLRYVEWVLSYLPGIGQYFKRRVCIQAEYTKPQ